MTTIAIANHKGGVGKTATAQTLGAVLAAEHGRRILLVDLDPQASLTQAAGVAINTRYVRLRVSAQPG